jgi:hypothetical protein
VLKIDYDRAQVERALRVKRRRKAKKVQRRAVQRAMHAGHRKRTQA